jgi:hypothetical protein
MQYLAWNDLLVGYFFKPDAAGKRVRLCVTSSVIEELGRTTNSSLLDFVAAIKAGPPWVTRQGVCQKAFQAMSHWRNGQLPYPPYVGYLSFFVLAAGLDGDFAPHAYYPRLRALLDEAPATGQYPSFNRMLELWDDLERWANEDMHGDLGEFRADIAGGWINVGLPVAQVILTENERECLHTIFAEAGLDPTSSPSDEQFAALLLARGHHRLRPRTLQLLQDQAGASEVRDLLISTALEELREWDGQFTADGNHKSQIYSTLRLCGRLNRVARRVQFVLRCRSKHDIPEEGLVLRLVGQNAALRCLDYVMGWSTELTLDADGAVFDPARLDWSAGASGAAEDLGWRFRLPASDVRIFEDGGANAIPGIVEIARLPKQKPFYLTCHSRATEIIETWGRSHCQDFSDLGIESGLPAGWKLFHAAGATSDALIRERFPELAFNSTVRVYFEDGVRSSRNQYFSFGLPQLVVDGGDSALVYCGETRLEAGEDGRYSIPDSIVRPGRLPIEVRYDEEVITRRSLFVCDEVPTPGSNSFKGDRFGRACQPKGDEAFVSGASTSSESPPYNVVFLPDVKDPRKHGKLIFIGRVPGQIAFLAAGEHPKGWDPVWAILLHRNGTVTFCGDSLLNAAPMPGRVVDKRQVQEWKRVLWHRRKRIAAPQHEGLKRLWLSYQEEARNL